MISKKEIKFLASLKQKKFRILHQKIVIEGSKLILDALRFNQSISKIIYSNKDKNFSKIRSELKSKNIPMELCTEKDSEKISNTKNSQQIFALMSYNQSNEINEKTKVKGNSIVIDGISDPGNLGTILRTCIWFGFKNIFVTNETVELFNPKTIRSGMGAHFHFETLVRDEIENILCFFKNYNIHLYGAHLDGIKTKRIKIDKNNKWGLILGNEAHGLSKKSIESVDTLVKIEGENIMESLNVAEAASIIMYQLYKGN